MDGTSNLTLLLANYEGGDPRALEKILPVVYDELRRLARSYLNRESSGHTLQPTALVHEAFFKLVDQKSVKWQNRAHFFGIAAQAMRRILTDYARMKKAKKRGGTQARISIDEQWSLSEEIQPDLIALDDALKTLSSIDARQGNIVELRYFGGLSIEEAAHVLNISPATIKREWAMAKAWLYRELSHGRN